MNKNELIEHYERKLLDMRCDDDEKICFSIKQRRDRKLKRELYNKFIAQIRALSITVVGQSLVCDGCDGDTYWDKRFAEYSKCLCK